MTQPRFEAVHTILTESEIPELWTVRENNQAQDEIFVFDEAQARFIAWALEHFARGDEILALAANQDPDKAELYDGPALAPLVPTVRV
jgi:hypothetical protein